MDEFNASRTSIISKLAEYYGSETGDTITKEESEEDGDGSVFWSCESDGEKNASEAEEGVSTLSSQSSISIAAIRRTLTLKEDEVAKEVTLFLERGVTRSSDDNGYIYILCFSNLPGKFKVGFTKKAPESRIKVHKNCYGTLKVIATTEKIPHPYQVEQLLLKEFSNKQYKLKEGCQKCMVFHRELLDVDKETLLRSLEKWTHFVRSNPYGKTGRLTTNAKENLPLPALRSYLGYKPTRRRKSAGPTPKKKGGGQDSQITLLPASKFKSATPTTKSFGVDEIELHPDGLLSALDKLQLTPSVSRRSVSEGVSSGSKDIDQD
ncbi:uncharacterized protein PFLUO_LOCUS7724 [Penicillium psychrofluorescens]|uniref:uncharacterized protein n=1 Tax=Penicillium psychrofluorescens TaxID=3158075 RepID=UPI003CCE227E